MKHIQATARYPRRTCKPPPPSPCSTTCVPHKQERTRPRNSHFQYTRKATQAHLKPHPRFHNPHERNSARWSMFSLHYMSIQLLLQDSGPTKTSPQRGCGSRFVEVLPAEFFWDSRVLAVVVCKAAAAVCMYGAPVLVIRAAAPTLLLASPALALRAPHRGTHHRRGQGGSTPACRTLLTAGGCGP